MNAFSILRSLGASAARASVFPASSSLPINTRMPVRYLISDTHKDTDASEVLDEPPDNGKGKVDPKFDRSKVISLESSMRYLESNAYKQTYGDIPVWVPYRRNFKGQFAPTRTRKSCIEVNEKRLRTSNPCPICRDEYLVIDYRNIKLLKQFISPFNGATLHWDKTGVCRTRQLELLVAIEKARDYGTITFDQPVRNYDYSEYYADWKPSS